MRRILVLLLALASPASAQAPVPSPATASAVATDGTVVSGALGEWLAEDVLGAAPGFWGAVLAARDGRVVLAKGYGEADKGLGRAPPGPVTPRHLFDAGSVAKQFTAAAALLLESEGKLSTEASIARHLPGVPPEKAAITVEHLLAHRSGLAVDPPIEWERFGIRDELVRGYMDAPLAFPPGERFDYNNANYFLLAAVIERASGLPFERYVKRRLFEGAGLADTGFVADGVLDARRATARVWGYGADRGSATALEYSWDWANKGATGVVTTVHDLYAWDRALRGSAVLPGAAIEKLLRPGRSGAAYGWEIGKTGRGTTYARHGGATRGYGAWYVRFLEEDAAIAVLGDDQGAAQRVAERLEARLFGEGPARKD